MSRTVTLEHGWFAVSDDPEQVIGAVINLVTSTRNRALVNERLAPGGDGFHQDTLASVSRVEDRDELPEPWDADTTLDPSTSELWALYRDPQRGEERYQRTMVLHGDELRALVARALALVESDNGSK